MGISQLQIADGRLRFARTNARRQLAIRHRRQLTLQALPGMIAQIAGDDRLKRGQSVRFLFRFLKKDVFLR